MHLDQLGNYSTCRENLREMTMATDTKAPPSKFVASRTVEKTTPSGSTLTTIHLTPEGQRMLTVEVRTDSKDEK